MLIKAAQFIVKVYLRTLLGPTVHAVFYEVGMKIGIMLSNLNRDS